MFDLTLPLDETTTRPSGREPFEAIRTSDSDGPVDFPNDVKRFSVYVHTGTHMDAPVHYSEGGKTMEELDVDLFAGEAKVVDLRHKQGERITADDLSDAAPGVTSDDRVVLITGDLDAQFREDDEYAEDVYKNAAVLAEDAAQWLVDREVSLVANDFVTESVSKSPWGRDPERPVHRTICGAGIPIVEYICNVDTIVDADTVQFLCLPLHLPRFEAAPVRVLAEPL